MPEMGVCNGLAVCVLTMAGARTSALLFRQLQWQIEFIVLCCLKAGSCWESLSAPCPFFFHKEKMNGDILWARFDSCI